MSGKETDLSPRYYIAEGVIWLLGGILLVSKYIGLTPHQPLPILNVVPASADYFVRIVTILLFLSVLYMVMEWNQSSQSATRIYWSRIRALGTVLCAIFSSWISWPLVVKDTRFFGISPAWYYGFFIIGILIGRLVSILAFSALMIRSLAESKTLNLPRIPVATKAQFITWSLAVVCLMLIYYVLVWYAPREIRGLASLITAISFVLMLLQEVVLLFLSRDENGDYIPYKKRIKQFKAIYDSHDYGYKLIGMRGEMDDLSEEKPAAAIQKDMQKRFSVGRNSKPLQFRVQQLEATQLQLYQKDGNPENKTPENTGVKVKLSHGKKESIRVLFMSDDSKFTKQELSVSIATVEKFAEEFIRERSSEKDFRSMLSYALNQAALETIMHQIPMLHRLVQSGQEEEVAKFVKNGANVNEIAEAGWTPLLYASAQGYPRIARILLDAGANPDTGNVHGITPLMYGARYGNKAVCSLLIKNGAALDLQDIHGRTALIVACTYGHEEIVKMLLKAGANTKFKTQEGKSAVDIAQESRFGGIARILRKVTRAK